MAGRWGNSGNSGWLSFSGLQNHCRWWMQPWNKKMFAPCKKSHDQPRQHIKTQRHYFADKSPLVKAMVFPVVMYGCKSCTIKKTEHRRIDASELWCWRRFLRVPWTERKSNQSILKEILNIHWKDWCWSWSSNTLDTWWEELTHWKRPWFWERLRAGWEGDDRGWGGWMASPTWWMWVWASFRRQWWRGKPGVLQSMLLQRVRHNSATELFHWLCQNLWLCGS